MQAYHISTSEPHHHINKSESQSFILLSGSKALAKTGTILCQVLYKHTWRKSLPWRAYNLHRQDKGRVGKKESVKKGSDSKSASELHTDQEFPASGPASAQVDQSIVDVGKEVPKSKGSIKITHSTLSHTPQPQSALQIILLRATSREQEKQSHLPASWLTVAGNLLN